MRLTLRAMLAYMDGLLEPDDEADIKQKIDESERATNLLHRTRDVMRRLRLAAPGLSDQGKKLDANTVAEYLDHALDTKRVEDFEKVCLDSDIHLSDVASCHQILALVLSEPAEVDPANRERMYRLIEQAAAEQEAEHPATSQPATLVAQQAPEPPAPPQPPETKVREKPIVPDYLRDPPKKRRWLPTAAAVALTACLVLIMLTALGQFEPDTPLGDAWAKLVGTQQEPADVPGDDVPEDEEPLVLEPTEGGMESPPGELPTDIEPTPLGVPDESPGTHQSPDPAESDPAEPPVAPGPEVAVAPGAGPGELPGETPGETPGEPSDVAGGNTDLPPDGPPDGPVDEPAVDPVAPKQMGRLMSQDQVLLSPEQETNRWLRVPDRSMVASQIPLVTLPTYRCEITLTAGINLQTFGGTRIELSAGDGQQIPAVRIDYGRLMIMPLAEAGKQLGLIIGEHAGKITFADADSVAALEVFSTRAPGTNPEIDEPRLGAYFYVPTGKIQWDEAGRQEAIEVAAPFRLLVDDQPIRQPQPLEELPKWLSAVDTVSYLDRRASPLLEQSLVLDRSSALGLRELHVHRQKEVRWLATRCLGYIGQFDMMVPVLDDPTYRPDWPDYVAKLQEAVSRGPKSAAAVRLALEKEYGPQDAPDMYRMLWGYTQQDLDNGEAATLVGLLDHERLAVRVVSFWNLKEITGKGFFYGPEHTAAKRRTPIARWRDQLKQGLIKIESPRDDQGATVPATPAEPPLGDQPPF